MKRKIILDIICLLLIISVIGIPIAIYLLRKSDDYGRSDNTIKPSSEIKEKEYSEEKRKFTPLYTKTTILPVLTDEDLKKYKEEKKKKKKSSFFYKSNNKNKKPSKKR